MELEQEKIKVRKEIKDMLKVSKKKIKFISELENISKSMAYGIVSGNRKISLDRLICIRENLRNRVCIVKS